jgi:hypothetical protein
MEKSKPNYKYESYLASFCCCFPKDFSPIQTIAFRFCTSDRNNLTNFLPVFFKDDFENDPNSILCTHFALSFYSSEKKLKKKVKSGKTYADNFLKRVGDHHIAVKLDSFSGTQTKPSKRGHFDLFEYEEFDCNSSIISHSKIEL